jgi:Flp pilus assembly protein TadB
MKADDFTPAEMNELFGKSRRRIISKRLDKRAMAKADAPFLSAPKDRAFVKHATKINYGSKRNSRKVLTILKLRPILRTTIKRKDDKMATKQKLQTNYMQNIAVYLLAAGAILGLADLLGGGLRACLVATLLVACLFVMAVDYRK